MELHAFDVEFLMSQAHDRAATIFFRGPGTDFQFMRQALFFDDEGVIACGRHGAGKALEDAFIIVRDRAGFAVHQMRGAYYISAEGCADGLMSKAHAQDRNLTREVPNEVDADSRILRCAPAWRNNDALRVHRLHIGDSYLVVAAYLDLGPQFSEILNEVVSEGIVIVEYEDHRLCPMFSLPLDGGAVPGVSCGSPFALCQN